MAVAAESGRFRKPRKGKKYLRDEAAAAGEKLGV